MRIPTREEFAPLPEAVAILGIEDPLAILPQLENQLDAVGGATTQLREIATGFWDAAEHLEAEVRAVNWDGRAGEQFRSVMTESVLALQLTAEKLGAAASGDDELAEAVSRTVGEILIKIAATAGVVAALLGVLVVFAAAATILAKAAAIIGLIGALAFFIYAFLEDLVLLVTQRHELMRRLIEAAREAYDQLRERLRDWRDPDRPRWRGPDPIWHEPGTDG